MSFRALIFLLAFTITDARLQGQRELGTRILNGFQICHAADETHYVTIKTNIFKALFHSLLHQSDKFEGCLTACERLCDGYSSFEATTDKCLCIGEQQESAEDAAATDRVGCPSGFAPSSTTGLCVQTCQSQYNPCGPGSACINDAALGHTCKPQYDTSVCPFGCGQHSSCLNGSCICDLGFERRESYLPCQKKP